MDAINKAAFINSVVNEETAETNNSPAFAPAFAQVAESELKEVEVSYMVEPESVFAQGLPEWSIEPPQVMVRRR